MEASKLEHFKQLLLAELRRHTEHVSEDQAAAMKLVATKTFSKIVKLTYEPQYQTT